MPDKLDFVFRRFAFRLTRSRAQSDGRPCLTRSPADLARSATLKADWGDGDAAIETLFE